MNTHTESSELDEQAKLDWYKIVFGLKKQFGKKPDINGILFIIGVRELGQNRAFEKHEKMDLVHIAMCRLLSKEGHYRLDRHDEDGWPHYTLVKPIPHADLATQENNLKRLIVAYFREEDLLTEL